MPIKKLNPYLNFNGTAAQAIKLYESALGAKVENVMPWTDMPAPTGPVAMPAFAPSLKSFVKNSSRPFGVRTTKTISDTSAPICAPKLADPML